MGGGMELPTVRIRLQLSDGIALLEEVRQHLYFSRRTSTDRAKAVASPDGCIAQLDGHAGLLVAPQGRAQGSC